MICLIEALNYRCLRFVRQPLGALHVLVGPNASGKTTFLDVVSFLGRLVSEGIEAAVSERTNNFQDLVWGRRGRKFELAVEAEIPEDRREKLPDHEYKVVRYEVAIGLNAHADEISILAEKVSLKKAATKPASGQRDLFPELRSAPHSILTSTPAYRSKTVVNKVAGGNDNYYSELQKKWAPSFKLGPRKSALRNLPADEIGFPVCTWLKSLLQDGIQQLVLNSQKIRMASPPGQVRGFRPDGSNLPWVIEDLRQGDQDRYKSWIAHLRTALPDIVSVRTIERPDDKHRYLVLGYRGGLEIPSWVASDGTLRLLALTLPAYLKQVEGIYLIEEPENGIHPRAVAAMFQSLSSVYGAQILMATHSPVILQEADADKVLCFARTDEGATDIILGSEHPKLRQWRGDPNLGVLFAGGVLG